MRKILSFLMMTLFAGSLLAAPYTLTFTYYDSTDGDGSAKLTTVEAIFSQESQAYVASVETGTQVYAGRKYEKDGNYVLSNLKLGSTKAAGELKFTLNTASEMDSIVFNAAMYSKDEGGDGFSVNGTPFTLSAGKLAFERCVLKPTGTVSTIDIVQTKASKGRFYLTSIEVYPKEAAGGEDPKPATRTLYCKVAQDWWKADGAAVGVYAFGEAGAENAPFPGVRMTAVEGAEDTWKADIDTALYKKVIFARMNPVDEGNQNWGAKTADLTIPADKDLYTITSTTPVWGDPGVTGEWSNYSPSVAPDPQPVLADGFYLIGKIGGVAGWAITDLKAEQMFAQNQENPGEYMLNVTLAEGDELKVVNVLNNEIATWYPGDDNFIVTAAYAGEKTVYFRPDGQGGEGWHRGCIYIAPNPATGISNNAVEGKAVKMIMDAQLLIIRNGKTYNVQGQQLK